MPTMTMELDRVADAVETLVLNGQVPAYPHGITWDQAGIVAGRILHERPEIADMIRQVDSMEISEITFLAEVKEAVNS